MDPLSSDLASLKIDRNAPPSRRLPVTALLLVALTLGGAGLTRWAYPVLEARVFKTAVKTGTIHDVSPSLALTSLTATGYVVAERRSKVGSNMPGRIASLHVREGSTVKAGDLLVELDAADQRGSVAAAQARVLAAQAKVALAGATESGLTVQLTRQRTLLDQQAAARAVVQDLEARAVTAEAEVKAAQAEVHAAEAQREVARLALGRMTILSPLDGTVLDKPLDVGETVDALTPILELADFDSLVVEIDVPETRLTLVKLGGPCEIALDAFPGRRMLGKVRDIGKRVNRSKATVPVKIAMDETTGVLPDMSARVSFLTAALDERALAAQSKLSVPAGAVTQRKGLRVVFVVDRGKVRMLPIKLGGRIDDGFEVVEGPATGTRVVLLPPSTLADGQSVQEGTE